MQRFKQRNTSKKKKVLFLFSLGTILLILSIIFFAIFANAKNEEQASISNVTNKICPLIPNFQSKEFSFSLNYIKGWLNEAKYDDIGLRIVDKCPSPKMDLILYLNEEYVKDYQFIGSTKGLNNWGIKSRMNFDIYDCNMYRLYSISQGSIMTININIKDNEGYKIGNIKSRSGYFSVIYDLFDSKNEEIVLSFEKGVTNNIKIIVNNIDHILARPNLALTVIKKILEDGTGSCTEYINYFLFLGRGILILSLICLIYGFYEFQTSYGKDCSITKHNVHIPLDDLSNLQTREKNLLRTQ